MQDRKRLACGILFVTTDNLITHMCIESTRFGIILVDIDFIDPALAECIFNQSLSISTSLFLGKHKQHFKHIIAYAHKSRYIPGSVTHGIQCDSLEILMTHQRPEELNILLSQKMMGSTYRPLPYIQQLIQYIIGWRLQSFYLHVKTDK